MDGFTKAEILVVVIILGLLSIVPAINFKNAQAGVRDSRRKADLRQIYNALEVYSKENNAYPLSKKGMILSCVCGSDPPEVCAWGKKSGGPREFCDQNNVVYLKELLSDPTGLIPFCYFSDGKLFRLYAKLEVVSDFEAFPDKVTKKCNGIDYNFGYSSPNTSPMIE